MYTMLDVYMYVNLNPEEANLNEENQEFSLAILKMEENSIFTGPDYFPH